MKLNVVLDNDFMSEKIKLKIKELVDLINKWNHEYFDLDSPTVSDRVYDSHLIELINLEDKYPHFILEDSPTKKIGATIDKNKFKKVVHSKKMLSLNKAYNFNEINKFINDVFSVTNDQNIKFIVQPKIDGLSIALKYKKGELFQALTRGDGTIGEDVTRNIKNIIKDIPVKIDYPYDLEVRGEVYISKKNFELINQIENVDYANARNLASGTLRHLDQEIVKKRNLSSFIYEIVNPENHNIYTQEQVIEFLKLHRFPFLENYNFFNLFSIKELMIFIEEFDKNQRNTLDYEIDGMVIKLNEIKYYEEVGYTTKFPKYMIAYKFDDELIQTILENVFITIGRTGIVTYNAKLKKVLLKGTIVSAATLHNYNYVYDLGINVNDEVTIKKAGEIIPKVISLNSKRSNGIFPKILICPYCNHDLVDTKTLNNQMCINSDCPEINIKKIIHFASKGAMDIEGLGEGIVRKFFELGFLKKIEDIYLLDQYQEQIIAEKGFGPKFWKNLKEGIVNSYKTDLTRLIFSLGIPQLGIKNAKSIAKKIKDFYKLFSITESELISINDIGEVTIKEFKEYIKKDENIKLFNFLLSIGINPSEINKEPSKKNDFFEGKNFVISGTFSVPRNEIIKLIEENNGIVSSTISKKTYALLLGENGGSKKDKAIKLNIKIIEKEEVEKLIT